MPGRPTQDRVLALSSLPCRGCAKTATNVPQVNGVKSLLCGSSTCSVFFIFLLYFFFFFFFATEHTYKVPFELINSVIYHLSRGS